MAENQAKSSKPDTEAATAARRSGSARSAAKDDPARTTPVARKSDAYHHGDLRRALLDATLELIEERGPEGFTLRAAARLAGVSDAAPYHHFADKKALLAAVAEEGFLELYDALEKAGRDEPSPKKAAQAMGTAYVLFAASHPAHFRVMVSRRVHEQTAHPELAGAARRAFDLVRATLLGSLSGDERELPREQIVFGSWALVHGLAFLAIDGHLGAVGGDPDRLRSLVDGIMIALSQPGDA